MYKYWKGKAKIIINLNVHLEAINTKIRNFGKWTTYKVNTKFNSFPPPPK